MIFYILFLNFLTFESIIKSKMEIEGFTFLADLKISVKKLQRLYRHVINQVERKFEKDYELLSANHLIEIFFKEIEAVHGLIEEVVSGRFDKNPEKIEKLIKIMNRNLVACANIFESHMGQELMQMGMTSSHIPKSSKPLTKILQYIQRFIALVMDSCFYVYILRMISGVNAAEFEIFTLQCRLISKNILISSQNNYKIYLSHGRINLLLMGINIKNSNYSQAKHEFYEAVTNILAALKLLENKRNQKNKVYVRQRRDILLLILVGLINYQRMLIQSDNQVGWEVGFTTIRELEKLLKFEQNSWRKYIRIQYETRQILFSKKMDQISNIYVPFICEDSDTIKNLLEETKIKKYVRIQEPISIFQAEPTRKIMEPRRTFYSTAKKLSNQTIDQQKQSQGYVITYNQSKTKNFIQAISKSSQIKGKQNNSLAKKNLRKSKFPSIDWFSQSQSNSEILNAIFSNNAQSKVQQIKKNTEVEQKQKFKQMKHTVKTQKKIKRSILYAKCCQGDQSFQISREQTKLKKKQYVIHRLISDENYNKNELSLKYQNNSYKARSAIKFQEENEKEKKSIEIGYTETFIKLVVQSKRKLNICALVDRYEIAKKRKKTRNYHVEILQFQLQKSIGNFVNPVSQTFKKYSKFSNSYEYKRNSLITNVTFIANLTRLNQQKEQQNSKKQKLISTAYNKSQEGIKQMLKKITANQQKYLTRRSPKKQKNYSQLYLSSRRVE